jgi:hypothetical protein
MHNRIKIINIALMYILFIILTFTTSLAQQKISTTTPICAPFSTIDEKIIRTIVPVIFISSFVLLLLVISGILKISGIRKARIPLFQILFILMTILLFIIPLCTTFQFPQYLEIPENFKMEEIPPQVSSIFTMLGLPKEWMYVPAIIYLFILPFAAIYALVWAFINSFNIFPAQVNRILALVATFMTIPIGLFIKIVWLLFSFIGIWSVVIFIGMFISGVFFRGMGFVKKEYLEFKKIVDIQKEKLMRVAYILDAIKESDAKTMKENLDLILSMYKDVLPVYVSELIIDAKNKIDLQQINEAKNDIKKAIDILNKSL